MIVSLDRAWRSELLFLPARNAGGKLIGLKVIVHFIGVENAVRIPTSLILPRLSPDEELTLFREKLALLNTCQLFFIQHQVTAWVAITPAITHALLTDPSLAAEVTRFSFIELVAAERFPGLNQPDEKHPLVHLAQIFPLVLSNFGSGETSTRAVFAGLFKGVILDRQFVQRQLASASFEPFIRAITTQVQPYCQSIMIAGINDDATRQRVLPFGFSAMFGDLWPAVAESSLLTLVQG
ncbi:EAL domain-containing protein [Pseudocitrobacter cyperus]|uniref:EAL domain-containing protein n=1 Tax=Pseudocitrobacter cyperus TaxID=3112843 RepID=A0ABV0HD79_9ENTR